LFHTKQVFSDIKAKKSPDVGSTGTKN